jgi:hypothetical protein
MLYQGQLGRDRYNANVVTGGIKFQLLKEMNWLLQIHSTHPVAHAIGVLALVCVAGMAVGSLKVRGVGLRTAGVLLAGILTGYFGKPVHHATLEL